MADDDDGHPGGGEGVEQSVSRMMTQQAAAISGVDDGTMEDVIEKLKILDYEANFCLPKTFRPLTRTYFSRAVQNPNEQFFYFTSLVSWLMGLAGHQFQAPGQFDDPNASATAIIYELKNMDFSVKDIAPGKLRVGNGDAVLHVLNILLDKVLTHRGWVFKSPEYPADNYEEEVEPDDGMDDDIQDDVLSESEGEEEWYGGGAGGGHDDDETTESSQGAHTSTINPELWKMELERVAPYLRQNRRADNKDWRSHVDWIISLLQTIEKWFPDVKAQLDRIMDDITKAIEKIQKREFILAQQFENWVDQYRTQKKDYSAILENRQAVQHGVNALTAELNQISDMLDSVKAEIARREGKMTDTSPLVHIKEAMTKVKNEVKTMELRIGVLQHATLQHKIRQANNAKKKVASGPKNPDQTEEPPQPSGPAA